MKLTMSGGFRSAEEFIEKALWFYDHSFKPDGDRFAVLTGYDRIANAYVIDAKDAQKAIATHIKFTLNTCRESEAYDRLFFTLTLRDDQGEGGFHMTYNVNDEIDPSQYFSLVRVVSDDEYNRHEKSAAHYDVERVKMEKQIKRECAKHDAKLKALMAKAKATKNAKKAKKK